MRNLINNPGVFFNKIDFNLCFRTETCLRETSKKNGKYGLFYAAVMNLKCEDEVNF